MTWALLPLKDLVRAKTRLSGLLAPSERRALAQAMAEDVLAALVASPGLDGVLLVSDDPGAELLAHRYGAELLAETELQCSGLNAVIDAASARLAGRGVDSVMVVHSDLPLLAPADVESLLASFRRPGIDVLLSPDRHHGGTNIMAFDASSRPAFHYGPGSCRAHQADILASGRRLALVPRDNVALDVDEPADLVALCQRLQGDPRPGQTARLLADPALRRRIALVAGAETEARQGTGS